MPSQVENLLRLLSSLVEQQPDQPPDLDDNEDFVEEQNLLGRLISLMQTDNPDQQYLVALHSCLLYVLKKIDEFYLDSKHGKKAFWQRRAKTNKTHSTTIGFQCIPVSQKIQSYCRSGGIFCFWAMRCLLS